MHTAPSSRRVSMLKTNGLHVSIVLRACLRLITTHSDVNTWRFRSQKHWVLTVCLWTVCPRAEIMQIVEAMPAGR